jgi:murein DD-endopeptidase MepM/ murein hydrolase activator NlpD
VKPPAAIPAFLLSLLLPLNAGAATPDYPQIRVLSRDDPLFVQQQSELDDFRRDTESRTSAPSPIPPLSIFEYARRKGEDLFSLNARIGVRYDTLATLNGAATRAAFEAKSRVLVPTQDGLFVSNPPRGWLEELMLSTRRAEGKTPRSLVIVRNGRQESVDFFPGESFTAMERKYFLGMLLRLPIDKARITSLYGWREDPFTGSRQFHDGLDLGAPEGTEVHAARDGSVAEAGASSELGNFVILSHAGGLQTLYGHLSAIHATLGTEVRAGAVIGAVGHTGRATGTHLHFEVLQKGAPTDPAPLLAMKKG